MKVQIIRYKDDTVQTLGKMYVVDDNGATILTLDTLELPYKDNQHDISCYPVGTYNCKKVPASHIPYEHIAIENIPNRAGCCIHIGNYHTDILGCTIVGNGLMDINSDGELDLMNSGKAFASLMAIVPDEFQLIVSDK